MEKYEQLIALVESTKEDFDKFYNRGNKTAGIRLRKSMQEIRNLAKEVRIDVQETKKNPTQLRVGFFNCLRFSSYYLATTTSLTISFPAASM